MDKKVKGYVTVFLSLILSVIIILITAVIEGVRTQTIRMETECVMDAGLSSIFAEYHREMVKQYGLLFIDDSYGSKGSEDNTKTHLLSYMNLNFSANDNYVDLTSLNADNCLFSKVSFASDNKGEVLRYQISQYMKYKSGLSLIQKDAFNPVDISSIEGHYEEHASKREALDGTIDEIVDEYNMNLPEDEDSVSISNPADSVEKLSSNSALYYGCRDLSNLSTKVTDISGLISNRQYEEGYGLYENQDSPYGIDDKALYMEYLFDKLSYKDKEKENACLSYQLEYLLSGKDGDIENLEAVAERIFRTRYVINVEHVYRCVTKQQEALNLATIATIIIGQPELEEAVKHSILLAWAYAESAKDMRILFDGYKLSLIKSEAEWNTPIGQIVDFKSHLDEYNAPSGSMGYKEYLYSFLLLQDKEKQNMRLMDVMEMDIRMTPGNQLFCINNLIYQLCAEVNVSSRYGKGYSISRGYSYR